MDKDRPLPQDGKRPDVAAYVASVRAVLSEAHGAASAAFIKHMRAGKEKTPSVPPETGGIYSVVAYDLNIPLRNALRVLSALKSQRDGGWVISDFEKHAKSSSTVARFDVCSAASAVLLKRFPGEGSFIVKS
jgi:hypothetical protein